MQGAWVQSLVEEDPTCLVAWPKKIFKKEREAPAGYRKWSVHAGQTTVLLVCSTLLKSVWKFSFPVLPLPACDSLQLWLIESVLLDWGWWERGRDKDLKKIYHVRTWHGNSCQRGQQDTGFLKWGEIHITAERKVYSLWSLGAHLPPCFAETRPSTGTISHRLLGGTMKSPCGDR